MEDKIDIHRIERNYEAAIRMIQADPGLDNRNRELILQFSWDCRIGKTVKGRAKKKISKTRVLKYIYILKYLSRWVGKPFDQASQEDMERLVCEIEENKYKTKGNNYSEETKHDFKVTLKKFYKWLGHPEKTEFIDMTLKTKDVPAITREEVETLVNSTYDRTTKAAIMTFFDGGPRAEELMNVRLKDVAKKNYNQEQGCYWINLRYSKTFARTIPLPLSTKYLDNWLEEHPEKHNPEAPLFPISYPALCKRVRVLAEKAIKKRLTLHMLRHSSATYWAPKLNRYQLCAKYGWAFSSDMPDRYIKRKGIIFEEIAEKGDVDQTSKLKKENLVLKEQMEALEKDHQKLRKALEFIMPAVMEKMQEPEFRKTLYDKRKEQLLTTQQPETSTWMTEV